MVGMKMLKQSLKVSGKFIIKHAPEFLTGIGTIGVIASVILTAKKSPEAKEEIDEAKEEWKEVSDKEKRVKADYIFKLVRIGAKHYWLVFVIVGGSITCFWLANHINLKRLMSAIMATGLSTKAKEELENKIKEIDGDKHLQKLKDEIDGDKVRNNPPVQDSIIDTGYGIHKCFEPITGRYFYSNIERVKKAVIMCRDALQKDGYLSLNDWFAELNLESTDQSLCWTVNSANEANEFDVIFSSQLTPEGEPVLVIRYEVNPTIEYRDW